MHNFFNLWFGSLDNIHDVMGREDEIITVTYPFNCFPFWVKLLKQTNKE